MNRKSDPVNKTVKGNKEKYLSYKEAFARIKLAKSEGFYLEAITIQESIITDRLISYFHGTNKIIIRNEKEAHKKYSFHRLIELLEQEKSIDSGLCKSLMKWKDDRNKCLHRIAKSFTGNPTQNIDEFLNHAKNTADKGDGLVRKILVWHKKMQNFNNLNT